MVLFIIFIGLGLSITLARYLAGKREAKRAQERERRDEQFLQLLETLKKESEKQD